MPTNRNRKNRNKKKVENNTAQKLEIVKETPERINYQYGVILPLEMPRLYPLMEELFQEIGHKEGMENPKPIQTKMGRDCRQDPYATVYGCFDEEYNPVGYIWIHATKDNWETPYLDVVQVVISRGWGR